MQFLARTTRSLALFALTLPLCVAAQTPAPLSDAERARRDAEKVFSFIKFQTVRNRPVGEAGEKQARPRAANAAPRAPVAPAPSPAQAATPTTPAPATAAANTPPPVSLPVEKPVESTPTAAATSPPLGALPPSAPQPTPTAAASVSPAALPAPATEEDDEDDAALQLQSFVPPSLTPEVNATLGAGSRNVKVRFTVEADGRVSKAEAAAGVPRRLAKPATDAILQWRFAPLPQARNVDVEIAFRRD
jgi:protein TonB